MELLRQTAQAWGIPLTEDQVELFERYYRLLIDWNRRVNLTRVTAYEAVQVRHFLDSLALLMSMDVVPAGGLARVVDVGAGPGLPGLALKIARPELEVTLIESVGKKAEFLRYVVRELRLVGVEVINERAEIVAHDPMYREAFSVAIARALAELPVALELTLPFVRIGGRVLLPRKGDPVTEVLAAGRALELLGGRRLATVPVQLPGEADPRGIVLVEKIGPTDERYPRRPGMPAKRPLK